MIAFWTVSALLALAGVLFVVVPLVASHGGSGSSRRDANLAIYRDQSREIDADFAAGTLNGEQRDNARRELQARLLEDVAAGDAAARARHGHPTAILISIALPLLAFGLYLAVGNPQALRADRMPSGAGHGVSAQQVEMLVTRLAARMKDNPEDAQGWILLARSYSALGRFTDAAQAYSNAVERLPPNAGLLADYADALAIAQGRQLRGEPEKIIAQALDLDPRNLKALALAATAAFQKQDYTTAAGYWQRMLSLLPPDSESARAIQANIAEARSMVAPAAGKRSKRVPQQAAPRTPDQKN